MAFRFISRQSIKDLNKSISMFSRGLSSEGGELGSGAGKGGGSGGSIREAGGAFGKQEAAREEEYFRRKQKEQLEGLKMHLHEEIESNQELIKKHQEAIAKAKKKIEELTHHN